MATLHLSEPSPSSPLFSSAAASGCNPYMLAQPSPQSSFDPSFAWPTEQQQQQQQQTQQRQQQQESRPPSPHSSQDSAPPTSVRSPFVPPPSSQHQNTSLRPAASLCQKSSTAVPTLSTTAVSSTATSPPMSRSASTMAGPDGGLNPHTAADLLRQAMMHRQVPLSDQISCRSTPCFHLEWPVQLGAPLAPWNRSVAPWREDAVTALRATRASTFPAAFHHHLISAMPAFPTLDAFLVWYLAP